MVYGASSSSAINMLILDMQFLFISYENVKNVYLRSYQKPYFEEQTIGWPKEKAQKDKQRYTKHYTEN